MAEIWGRALPLAAMVLAYGLGSLSFAVVVSRALGLADPRSYGSKNPGATNVLRSGSKLAAVVTLLLDAAKGWLPVELVRRYGAPYGLEEGTQALVGLAAFLGHLYPVFFRFQGGKGVATVFGVWLGLEPVLALLGGLTWLLVAKLSRYSSLASLMTAVAVPLAYVLLEGWRWWLDSRVLMCLLLMSGWLLWRHRLNMQRLLAGTESRLGQKQKAT